MAYKHCIGFYVDQYDTLLPSDASLGDVALETWYLYIKGKFDNMAWSDFYEREIFNNHKFTCHDTDSTYSNIVKTIKFRLINKNRVYAQMFKSFMADFNPLWNVDGVTGRITESTHTGTDTDEREGSDTVTMTGGHSTTRTGNEELEYAGKEDIDYLGKETTDYLGSESLSKYGSETHTKGGNIVETDANTTTESTTFYDTHKKTTTPTDTDELSFSADREDVKEFANRSDEKSYTNRTDEKSFTDRTDTTTYNEVKDEFAYDPYEGEKQETGYDSTFTKTLNLTDKDLELIIRQGNIGVTRSDELILRSLELFDNYLYDFVKYVVMDCIDQVSYAIW